MLQSGDHPPGAPGLSRDRGLRKDLDRSRSEPRRVETASLVPAPLFSHLERAEEVDRVTLDRRSSFDFRASATCPSCPPEISARRCSLNGCCTELRRPLAILRYRRRIQTQRFSPNFLHQLCISHLERQTPSAFLREHL